MKPAAIDKTLAALADPHRRKVVDLLREKPRRAGELSEALGLSPPAMSRHLRTLRECGIIAEESPEFDARVRIYTLRTEQISGLKDWLAKTETMWAEQLTAFKRHIEK